MFGGRPQAPRAEKKAGVDKALTELKRRLGICNSLLPDLAGPELDPFDTFFDEKLRKSVLDQRAALGSMKTSLGIVQACIQDVMSIWPEGRHPLSMLRDATKLGMKGNDNSMEENLLWDRPNPRDAYADNRRRQIFIENRRLGPEADRKFAEACGLILKLTGFDLME